MTHIFSWHRVWACVVFSAASILAITVTLDIQHGGVDCYEIATTSGTYYYDPTGGGLAGFVDIEERDWIGFNNTAGSGASGEYRGFPNAVHSQDVSCFHPLNSATAPSVSTLESHTTDRVVFKVECGNWKATWEFYETHCNWTLTSMTAGKNFWVLYEGTPNGAFNTNSNYLYRSDTQDRHFLSAEKNGDIAPVSGEDHEWIYFSDTAATRGLLLIQHADDTHGDRYYAMNPMTVFGFGRPSGASKVLNTVPATYTIMFVETTDWDDIAVAAKNIVDGETGVIRGPMRSGRLQPVGSAVTGVYSKLSSSTSGMRVFDMAGKTIMPHNTTISYVPYRIYIAAPLPTARNYTETHAATR